MKKIGRVISIFFLISSIFCLAQKDKIVISATLDTLSENISVNQRITFYNDTKYTLNSIFLHAVANSYSNNHTVLGKRKLEDRNKVLYFSKIKERGKISDFTIFIDKRQPQFLVRDFEFYEISLPKLLEPNDSITLELNYNIKLPFDKISGYGYSNNGNYLLKHFFLQPLNYKEGKPILEPFTDTEFNPYRETEYSIEFYYPGNFHIESDLKNISKNKLEGVNKDAVSILISKNKPSLFQYEIEGKNVEVSIGYAIDDTLYNTYYRNIERELKFLYTKLGVLPSKIFLNSKTKKNNNFIGIDDIDFFGVKEWILFPDDIKIDHRLFQQIASNIINQSIIVDKNKNHWIPNGLLTYYQYQYLKKYYPEAKLIGNLADELSMFKIKPLKYFFISKVPLTDRYKLGYRYIATQNYDQPIDENYLELSNINQFIISSFKAGLSFNFLSEYIGVNSFESSIRALLKEKKNSNITSEDLQNTLEKTSTVKLDWFFSNYIKTNDRVDLKIKKFYSRKNEDSIKIRIKNRTNLPVPILITAEKEHKDQREIWVFSTKKDSLYAFPKGDYDKLLLNKNYLFPEINDNDNTLNTTGVFKNRKKIQMKFYADVDNPDYNQIFYEPKIKWNNYDKFILGLRFHNKSPFSRPFEYSFAPTFSTGTNSLTGSGALNYNYDMEYGIFRRISLGTGYNYYHYDKGLAYKKYSGMMNFIFNKRSRTEIDKVIGISFNSIDREQNPLKIKEKDNYSNYNLLDISYSHSDKRLINEWFSKTIFQHSNLFNKFSTEVYYRHEYAANKKITLRFFGGYFFNNKSNSTYFNFGVDHITDYGFNYMDYLGRSATSGLLYQQYIMAEGGFKSMVDKSVSKWITSLNGEIHLWKPFDFYADAGVYKSIGVPTHFIFDTGIKLKIIPDFLEIYFPLQSTLGFEPARNNYFSNIRFTFNLNIPAAISHFRKGWY